MQSIHANRTEQEAFKKILPMNEKNIFQHIDYTHKPRQEIETKQQSPPQKQPPIKPFTQASNTKSRELMAKPKTEAKQTTLPKEM